MAVPAGAALVMLLNLFNLAAKSSSPHEAEFKDDVVDDKSNDDVRLFRLARTFSFICALEIEFLQGIFSHPCQRSVHIIRVQGLRQDNTTS